MVHTGVGEEINRDRETERDSAKQKEAETRIDRKRIKEREACRQTQRETESLV